MEIWKPVVGYEGLYEVSDQGRVRSVDRTIVRSDGVPRAFKGKDLTPTFHEQGYPLYLLWKNNKGRRFKSSVLVLEAFKGPRPEGYVARHYPDRNPLKNHISNLSWSTASVNSLDMREHGTHWQVKKEKCPQGHLLQAPNLRASELQKGSRACLACSRARAHAQRNGGDWIQLSDAYYVKIMC